MRVGSGWAKGQILKAPPGEGTRPTSDKIKSAIFDALGSRVRDAKVLDLFAGSGALGIEALSRGGLSCQFVEVSKVAAKFLKENTSELLRRAKVQNLQEPKVIVSVGDVAKVRFTNKFDIIMADPPYAETEEWVKAFEPKLNEISNNNSLFILESSAEFLFTPRKNQTTSWVILRDKTYGTTRVSVWKKEVNCETE